jgi:hypothetical protein
MENEIYIVDGQQFNVHPSQKDEFLKKYPNAELQNATPAIRNNDLNLPDLVVDPQEKKKRSDFNVSFGGPGAMPSMPINISRAFRGGSGILNFLGKVPEFAKGATELILKTKANAFPYAPLFGDLNKEQRNQIIETGIDAIFDPLLEKTRGFAEASEAINLKFDSMVQEDPNRSIYDEFFSEEGNFSDGIDKLVNGVVDAVPSVMAAFGGQAGYATLFASASGDAYKRKTDVDPEARGGAKAVLMSSAQGGVELLSEMVTRGIVKGFGNTILSRLAPQTVKNIYKTSTKTLAGRVLTGSALEGSSEVAAQETNRFLDYIWDGDNAFGYQNPDGSYNVGNIVARAFDTYMISSIVGGGLGAASSNPNVKAYTEERLSPVADKKKSLEIANKISKLESEYVKNPNPLIEQEILDLQQQVVDQKILNEKVLNSFNEVDLLDYAAGKIAIAQSKEALDGIEDVEVKDQLEKTIEKQEKALDKQYNEQKAIILMLNFGPKASNTEIKQKVAEKKSQTIREEVNETYDDATTNADWKSKLADEAISKLYGDGENGALARIIKNKITGEMTRLPGFDASNFISETVLQLIPHIRNFKPELASINAKNNLAGWINGFIDNKIKNVLKGKKATKEQFETEISGVQETQFDIDDSTQETLDFVRTEPEAKEQLRDVVGITKESVQSDAQQIIKGKLPGILEKSGRDKNEILTAINNASQLKIADAVLEEMGGNFNNKQEQNSRFITFMDTNFDAIIKAIPNSVKNKLPLFEAKQIDREDMVQGDEAGKGIFEYKNPTRDEFIKYYTEGGLNTLRAKKKRLADVLAQEIGKDAIAEVLQDPAIQQEFLDRQAFQKKEIPKDAIPKFLARIDRTIAGLESSLKNQTLQMDITGGIYTAGKNVTQFITLKLLKAIRRLLGGGANIEQASTEALSEIANEMNLSPEQAQVFAEGVGTITLKDLTEGKLTPKVEQGRVAAVKTRLGNVAKVEVRDINVILNSEAPITVKQDKLVEFFKFVAPTFQKSTKSHELWKGGDNAAAAYKYWNEQFNGSLAQYNITLKKNKIVHNGKPIFLPISATRPRTTKQVLRNAIKKYGSVEKAIPVIEAALELTDDQALQNREYIIRHSKDLLLTNGKQAVIDFISMFNVESDSALRLSGTIRAYENVSGTDFVYEHTPAIQDLQKQIYDIINNTDNNADIIDGIRKILETSRVDLISDKAAKKLDKLGRRTSGRDFSRYEGVIDPKNLVELKRVNEKRIEQNNEVDLDTEFNKYIEASTGIAAVKRFDEAKAIARGKKVRKGFGDYFVPPGAEDFAGLMHNTLAKGKKGEEQLEFYKKYLYEPYNAGNESITREKSALLNDFHSLKSKFSNVPKRLKNYTKQGDYTNDTAVRVFIWNQQGMKVPGLSKTDQTALVNEVKADKELLQFANELVSITKGDGYIKPETNWAGGNIATDLMGLLNTSKRSKHLEVWQNNVDQIFSKENLFKLEAGFGKEYVTNLKKTLERMKTGMNRKWGGDPKIQAYLDWVNGSVGAIMFLNTRSAVLQTISNINYLNFSDNNPLRAAAAFANQKQYWSDFIEIFNSDYLTERRGGNKINVNESELALAAEKGGIQGTISLLLNKGFILTRMADSFAIATGGASMYRNRIKTYTKQGLSEADAQQKAFLDFKAITEETQQSSRPDRISEQQASNAGRLLLAFANTPMQYNRIIKKNAQDLFARRGDPKEKISKIIYYSTIQNLIFNAMQKALFALAFADGDDTEEEIEKYAKVGEGMLDTLLRGSGFTGNFVYAGKNLAKAFAKDEDPLLAALTASPPLHSKLSKIRGADYSRKYITEKNILEPKLDNPALSASSQFLSATFNLPLDRALRKAQNIEAAMSEEAEYWQKVALALGWNTWEVGLEKTKKKRTSKKEQALTDEEGLVKIDLNKF